MSRYIDTDTYPLNRRVVLKAIGTAPVLGMIGTASANPNRTDFECSEGTYAKLEFVIEEDDDGNVIDCYFVEETDTGLVFIESWESKGDDECEPVSVTFSYAEGYTTGVLVAKGAKDTEAVQFPGNSYDSELKTPSGKQAAISNIQFCIVEAEEECIDILGELQAGDEITAESFDNIAITSAVPGNTIIAAEEGVQTGAFYGAPNDNSDFNGCMGDKVDVGFGDIDAKSAAMPQNIDFTFDTPVSEFELRMLDYGDYNPQRVDHHKVVITAYNAGNNVVDSETLEYWSNGGVNPTTGYDSSAKTNVIYNDLWVQGDACGAVDGEPGDYTFELAGNIARVELRFPVGHDPNIAFDLPCTAQ